MVAGSGFLRWLRANTPRLLLSILVSTELHDLGGAVLGSQDVQLIDMLDVGSIGLLTVVLYIVYLPGMFIYFQILRRATELSRRKSRRLVAVVSSPVIAIVLGLLYAIPGETSQGWIAVVGEALLFGMLVKFPTLKSVDR